MENLELQIIKPEFNEEIKANIKSFGEIESNMEEVKSYVENLNNYYKNITFTEETMKDAKEDKAKINKFKKQVAEYRKNIVAKYNEPINFFEGTAKETEALLTDTYNGINIQVANFENKQKQLKEQEIKDYFEEYKKANNIDFVMYEQAKINVTLTASIKSLKEQAKEFIDKITDDLNLIETQEHKAEILVEYKQTLNVSNAITTVTNRFKAIEEEKKKQEELKQRLHNQISDEADKIVGITETDKELAKDFIDRAVERDNKDKFVIFPTKKEITIKFNLYDDQSKQLKKFLELSNIEYESEDL
ncbi:MAG: DUF1351 domain-containing protein [Clostridia bacterium]|nr:DUF1351 domain-containing protein [Clostridia bacterium]